jgi:UDP-N-acetylmuramoyl-tripeptide--D-alanyl-D-alanine ligase
MIPLRRSAIEALELGELVGGGASVTAIHADSRVVGEGDLFVALNSGVAYVEEARARGAATLVPNDQNAALAALATLVRSRSAARVAAVVGSTGKTSTKDILGALCAAIVPTVAAEGSLNNEIGLPLTLFRLEPETEVLVVELGMRGLGQVAELSRVARPDVVVVTSIGPEHLELLGSVENVARANAEAIAELPAGGTAIVPADAQVLEPFLDRADVDVRRFDVSRISRDGSGWRFDVGGTEVTLTLPFDQRHMVENVLAALHAYDALGLPLERAQEGAARITLSRWRGEATALPGGGFVVNDAYNANPTSMRAALLDLAERGRDRRRVAILGEMAELGDESAAYHREIGAVVAETVDVLVAIGPLARHYLEPGVDEMRWLPTVAGFDELVRPGDAILVKGSRSAGLEGVPERLAKVARTWQ